MIFDANIDWTQLARYFAGESPPEERAVIEARVETDVHFREAFEHAEKAWNATGKPSMGVDKQKAWSAIDLEIKQGGSEGLRIVRRDRLAAVNKASRGSRRTSSSWAVVSFFLMLFAVAFYYVKEPVTTSQDISEVSIFKTTAGQRASITLPDGSVAMLNAESRIRVMTGASDTMRIIELDGEAFFSVVSDPLRPFIVRAGEAEVRVVGTSFNVSAYPEEEAVEVLVAEGEVKLRNSDEETESVTLTQNDLGIVPQEGLPTRSHVESLDNALAWRQGKLVFEHTSFDVVARTMERWFDLEIHFDDPEIANRHLSSSFEDPTPNHVLAIVASTLSLDYTIQESTVTFSIPERQ